MILGRTYNKGAAVGCRQALLIARRWMAKGKMHASRTAVSLLAIAILATGCTAGITPDLPSGLDANSSARVIVGRNRNLIGSGVSSKVYLDGFLIARLRVGDYIDFPVEPGSHSIGADLASVGLEFAAGEVYYFLISVAPSGLFEIERVHADRGTKILSEYERLNP